MVRRYETAENILRELWENVAKAAKFALADGVEFVMQKAWASALSIRVERFKVGMEIHIG